MAERKNIIDLRQSAARYDDDFAAWAIAQAEYLASGRFSDLDIDNLTEEVSALAKRDFRRLVSVIEVVLVHLLKFDHQGEKRSRSWTLSILEHRDRIERSLRDSPSFLSRLDDAVSDAYRTARTAAARETGLPLATFPEACPYGWDDVVNRPFDADADFAAES